MRRILQKGYFITIILLGSNFLFSQTTIGEYVDKYGERYVKKRKNYGLVIGIIKGEETLVKSYGQMSKKDKSKPDVNTVFEIGATTSVFTTTLMQLLADKNKFQQDDPVHSYLKKPINIPAFYPLKCVDVNITHEVEDLPISGQRIYRCFEDPMGRPECISFCDLATHISGIRNSPKGWYKWKPVGKNRLGNQYKDGTIDEYYDRLGGIKLEYVPGTKYIYSDFGIALLGNIMSEIMQVSFEELLNEELLLPLGMLDTRFDFSKETNLRIAQGHSRKGKQVNHWNFEGMAPAAGLKSTMYDLLLFVKANLRMEKREFQNAFAEVQQNKVNVLFGKNGRPTSMGYGWFTSTLNTDTNLPVIWVNGGTGGFRSFIGFVKDTNTAIVILSNSANSVDEMGFEILEILNAEYRSNYSMK